MKKARCECCFLEGESKQETNVVRNYGEGDEEKEMKEISRKEEKVKKVSLDIEEEIVCIEDHRGGQLLAVQRQLEGLGLRE